MISTEQTARAKHQMMRRLALLNCILVTVLVAAALTLDSVSFIEGASASNLVVTVVLAPCILVISVLAYLIITRRPGNVIGHGFSAVSLTIAVTGFVEAYLNYGLEASPRSLPNVEFAAWVSGWIFVGILPLMTFLFLLCPDGRLPSRRWRSVALGIGANQIILDLAIMLSPLETYPEIDNPFRVSALGDLPEIVAGIGYVGLIPSIGLSALAMVQRFRRSTGIERLQLKWFASAAVGALALFLLSWAIALSVESDEIWSVAFGGSIALVALAASTAILRYRLYDIDWIINRTLVYVPLTAILAGLFVAMTGLTRTVFTDLTDTGSDAATAMSTLAVVALLTPVKNQLQAFVDKRFKEQHDPHRALKELVGEALSVTRIMDRNLFIESVLEEITAALDVQGATVELGGSNGGPPKSYGQVGETPAFGVPLLYKDMSLGKLTVWLPADRYIDEGHLAGALEGPADALARVIGLLPEGSPWSEPARNGDGATRIASPAF